MNKRKEQLLRGLIFGILFGFLLQKGGVTKYDVIVGQLLLEDFTVLKIMLTAVLVGAVGLRLFQSLGWAQPSPKAGSWGGMPSAGSSSASVSPCSVTARARSRVLSATVTWMRRSVD